MTVTRSRTLWWIGITAASLYALNRSALDIRWVGLIQDSVSAAAVVALCVGVLRRHDPHARSWFWIGLGIACWVAGDFVWDVYALLRIARPDLSLADPFYLMGYPLLAWGFLQMARARAGRYLRDGVLDGVIFAVASSVAVWRLLVVPTAAGTRSFFTAIVWSSYPLGDVLLVAAVAWLALAPGRRGMPTYLLLAALVGTFVLDVLYTYIPTTTSSFHLVRLDWLFTVTYVMFAAAALHRDSGELTTAGPPSPRMHPARLVLLGCAVGAATVVAILTNTNSVATRAVFATLCLLLTAAVALRFALAVRAREAAQVALAYRATHDGLTGAVNRVLLIDRIGHALNRTRRHEPLAVLSLDLDRFKSINDTLGHQVGDALLVEVASRIKSTLRSSDTLGRFGGDEFIVLCEDIEPEHATRVAERIVTAVAEPMQLAALTVQVTVSVGLAVNNDQPTAVDALIKCADAAMNAAKQLGGDRLELYDARLRESLRHRLEIQEALRNAILGGELALHYQPVVRPGDGSVAGFEALLRWQRADGALIAPTDFIPIAEETGLIVPIGDWVIDRACDQLRAWQRQGIEDPWISINASALQLRDGGLREKIEGAIARTGADPTRLVLEITESAVVAEGDADASQLRQIRRLGVRIAIDDFGTGYSSLAYLRKLPVDMIKIDQSFVPEVGADPSAMAVLSAIVHLAHVLEFEVIAEGAETEVQRDLLLALDCDYIQGFFYAHPAASPMTDVIARYGLAERVLVPQGVLGG